MKPGILNRVVPILCKDVGQLTEQDHIELWHAHNHLSHLLSPVTAESLEMLEDVNTQHWWNTPGFILTALTILMILVVLLVFNTQAYSIMMDKNIESIVNLQAKINKLDNDEFSDKKAFDRNYTGNNDSGKVYKETNTAKYYEYNKKGLEDTINALFERQFHLNHQSPKILSENKTLQIVNFFECKQCKPLKKDPTLANTDDGADKKIEPSDADNIKIVDAKDNETIMLCAKTILYIINNLFLPMLLGFLGAIAFICRGILNQLNDATFSQPSLIKYILRIVLGGLLGIVGPWLYTSGKVEEMGLGLILFAFLLGYSVELAFTIFDNFIKFLREKIKLGNETKAIVINESPITMNPGDKIKRYDEPEITETNKPSTTETADFLKTMESYRSSLMELTELAPLLETVTLPEYFQTECAPKLAKAAELLQQLDGYQTTTPDITSLVKVSTDFTDACKQITGENHPLAAILDNAVKSFKGVSNNSDLSIIESFVVTLFTAAIAAFSKDANVYSRWKAYAWLESFKAANINGLEITDACIEACLTNAPLFQTAFDNNHLSPNALCKAIAASENLDTLAEQLWSDPSLVQLQPADLESLFGTLSVFTEATNEFGFSLLRYMLEKIDFPEGHFNTDTRLLSVTETLQCLDTFRQNQASEKDLDLLCHLSIELMRRAQTSSSLDAVGLIQRLMPKATSASTNL